MHGNKNAVEEAWQRRDEMTLDDTVKDHVDQTMALLNTGKIRVAENTGEGWQVNTWVKKAVLLSFKLHPNRTIKESSSSANVWYDKVPLKFSGWNEEDFVAAGIRAVPGSFVRYGAFISAGVVLMPSFVNIGAYVGKGTMVDTWATVGSCAQVGENCHISGGTGIGGVLEPLQASPVIIEDNCFIGARSEVAEGVLIGEGSVLSMGGYLGQSTPIFDRETEKVTTGSIPPYSVVVPGILPGKNTYAAVIVKKVDAGTRAKTSINELLRP
jgi:2,3,4,5-tetrahydropyridine-2-carboxylate N-succinyltransferase